MGENGNKWAQKGGVVLYFGIFILAGVGAMLRWSLQLGDSSSSWPAGLFVANILGSALLGYVMTNPSWLPVEGFLSGKTIAIGFLGGLTTFSGYSFWLVGLIQQGQLFQGGALLLLHNVLCIGSCLLAYRISL